MRTVCTYVGTYVDCTGSTYVRTYMKSHCSLFSSPRTCMDGVTLPVTNDTDCGISVLPGVHSPLLMVLSLHNGYTFHNPSFLLVQFCKQLLRVCTGLQWDLVAFVALGRLFLLSYLHCCDGGLVGGRHRLENLRHVGPLGVRVGVELDKLTAGRRNWM